MDTKNIAFGDTEIEKQISLSEKWNCDGWCRYQ